MRSTVTLCCLATLGASAYAQAPSMLDSAKYRLSWGDLNHVVPAPVEKLRALRIEKGSDILLQTCLAHPDQWRRDPLISRFGHGHPFTTIGCRERTGPSMHVVFYRQPDGSRQAWIHFDRYRPGNLAGHAAEVLQNRLTFGRTSQTDIFRSLVLRRGDASIPLPPPHYDLHRHAIEYLKTTFSPASLLPSIVTGGSTGFLDETLNYGSGGERYLNHIEANLVRHIAQQSIEFGFAALLQQDESFATSDEKRVGKRMKAAIYHSFFVPGRNGDELAFPRLAAALGTGWMTHEWHPWRSDRIDPWQQASLILCSYIARSFWHEFKPDLKSRLHKTLQHGAGTQDYIPTPGSFR